jgi:hypothetical protein
VRAAAALLLALCAAGPARGEGDTLERGAQADASLEERLKEKARTIPGTETRYVACSGTLRSKSMRGRPHSPLK